MSHLFVKTHDVLVSAVGSDLLVVCFLASFESLGFNFRFGGPLWSNFKLRGVHSTKRYLSQVSCSTEVFSCQPIIFVLVLIVGYVVIADPRGFVILDFVKLFTGKGKINDGKSALFFPEVIILKLPV